MKQSDSISRIELVNKRGWKEDLISIYLGGGMVFSNSYAINIENYLTRLGINFKADTELPKERLNEFFIEKSKGRSLVDELISDRKHKD